MSSRYLTSDAWRSLQELRAEVERDPSAGSGFISQLGVNKCVATQSLTHMSIVTPTVMMPILGEKIVTVADTIHRSTPGNLLVLPEGIGFDVENVPDRRENRYLGIAIRFDAPTMALFRQLYGARISDWNVSPRWLVKGSAKTIAATTDWLSWIRRFPTDQAEVRHRMVELMLMLAIQGAAGNLILNVHQSWRARLKHLLALDPARAWRIQDTCRRLGISESALRRNLRRENTGFRELLEEVRLDQGVALVMETDMLIHQIALACGYQSQSRFSERFKLRYSMSPAELRHTRTKNPPDAAGTAVRLAFSSEK